MKDVIKIVSLLLVMMSTQRMPVKAEQNTSAITKEIKIEDVVSVDVFSDHFVVENDSDKKYVVVLSKEDVVDNFFIEPMEEAVIPFAYGEGVYKAVIYRNTEEKYYLPVTELNLVSEEEYDFLSSNVHVKYDDSLACTNYAEKVSQLPISDIWKVRLSGMKICMKLYYSIDKAERVGNGYVTDLHEVEETREAICCDYAIMFAAMLRTEGIPCKVIFGNHGEEYHAWNEVFYDGEWHTIDLLNPSWLFWNDYSDYTALYEY